MTLRVPVVALVGRPNVGKSTLYNRFVGRRTALVMDMPGVTRDRLVGEATVDGKLLRVVDTGGLDVGSDDVFLSAMHEQTQLAIDEADLILLVLDVHDGLRPDDAEIMRMLRRGGKDVIAVVNKVDAAKHDDHIADFYPLGIDTVVAISAEHGIGFGELQDLVVTRVDAPDAQAVQQAWGPLPVDDTDDELAGGAIQHVEWSGGNIRVAVVGKPNVGKSSLVNCLLGEERLLTTNIAGTTRDAVDIDLERDGQAYTLVDTAGMRRKRSIVSKLEKFSVMGAVRSIDQADVAVIVLDASQTLSEQDVRVAALAHERGKGLVIVVNKWDLTTGDAEGEGVVDQLRRRLPFLDYAQLMRISAKTGRSVGRLLPMVKAAQEERHRRIVTSELNRFCRAAVEEHEPPSKKGRRPKLYYVSQPLVRPPTFVFMAKHCDILPNSYKRYLENGLRKRYGFVGTPIWLKFRERGAEKS